MISASKDKRLAVQWVLLLLLCCAPHMLMAETWHRVEKVIDGDTIITSEGDHIRLVGIQAPEIAHHERPAEAFGEESRIWLTKAIEGKDIRLEPAETTRDRHGRMLGYLYDRQGRMIQQQLLSAGMAMVYSFPENRKHVPALLEAETKARRKKTGLWALPRYQPLTPEIASEGMEQFRLVEGTATHVAKVKGHWYVNFGDDWKEDFTLFINRKNKKAFDEAGIDIPSLKGKKLRARGWIFYKNGPMIEVTHPEQLEMLHRAPL